MYYCRDGGDVDKIRRLDSYEQLNDVKFEGFSSLQGSNRSTSNRRSKSDKGTNTLNRRTVAVREGIISLDFPKQYSARNKGMQILLSNSRAEPGRTVKQEQEEISRNHIQAFIPGSVDASTENCGGE